jgi:hypothetical protein
MVVCLTAGMIENNSLSCVYPYMTKYFRGYIFDVSDYPMLDGLARSGWAFARQSQMNFAFWPRRSGRSRHEYWI